VTGHDPALRRRRIDELIAKTSKPGEARAIAKLFLALCEKYKADLAAPLSTE